ncbi:MAG: trans-sulfuration enzyme family protein [Thermoplasmatota archaeon]
MADKDDERKLETIAVHGGRKIDEETKAVNPPITLSTTFERDEDGEYPQGYIYTRDNNPNRESLEKCINELEGGGGCAAFSSGTAGAMAIFQSVSSGDHIIAPDDVYHGTQHQLNSIMKKWDIDTSYVDMTDAESVEEEIREDTELFWIETPSNPLLKITDIEKISKLAHDYGCRVVVDNTWSTPVGQRPLEYGADMVIYSTTKYFGGHSDAMGGAVVTKEKDEFFESIREIQKHGGASPSPFDCWLIMRGIRTLPYRMRSHSKNAMKLAKYLESNPRVTKVHYPGLKSHPGHEIADSQMSEFSGMLSFQVEDGREKAFKIAANVNIFTRATSLGSVESLIEHRASIEGEGTTTPDNLLRLSVGLENPDDLIGDLEDAIEKSY